MCVFWGGRSYDWEFEMELLYDGVLWEWCDFNRVGEQLESIALACPSSVVPPEPACCDTLNSLRKDK